jgi:hypothetical protein
MKRASIFAVVVGVAGLSMTGVALSQTGGTDQDSGPPPPPLNAQTFMSQSRLAVSDSHGMTRGTIPMSAYRAAIAPPESADQIKVPDRTPVPVLDNQGHTAGYWIPTYGFVESEIVGTPGFDPDSFVEQSDREWWNSLSESQRQQLLDEGVQPPS